MPEQSQCCIIYAQQKRLKRSTRAQGILFSLSDSSFLKWLCRTKPQGGAHESTFNPAIPGHPGGPFSPWCPWWIKGTTYWNHCKLKWLHRLLQVHGFSHRRSSFHSIPLGLCHLSVPFVLVTLACPEKGEDNNVAIKLIPQIHLTRNLQDHIS